MELSPAAQNEPGAELLSRLEQNPIGQAGFTPKQLRSPEFMPARLDVERLVGKLGPLRYEPAIPLLKRLHQLDDSIFNLLRSPGWALLMFNRPDAHEFLRSLLYGTFRQEAFAVSSYLILGDFDGLAPHLDPSRKECHNVINETLSSLWSGMGWTGMGGSPRSLLLGDRRWIQFALQCRDRSEFAVGARSVLKNLFPDELKQAVEEFKKPNLNETISPSFWIYLVVNRK